VGVEFAIEGLSHTLDIEGSSGTSSDNYGGQTGFLLFE
jgi:hypothetical protein